MVHIFNSSTKEVEMPGALLASHPYLIPKFQANEKSCLKSKVMASDGGTGL